MQITIKRKHGQDFTELLIKAKEVANFAVKNKGNTSSRLVKHIGLHSTISCQILRKYGRNWKAKKISNANLIIPGQAMRIKDGMLRVVPLKLEIPLQYFPEFTKVNQVEAGKEYCYITVTVAEIEPYKPTAIIGVDRNTKGHIAVCANLSSGKVLKLGKSAQHTANKYVSIRKKLQSLGKYKAVKNIKDKQARTQKDLNHKVSRRIVNFAVGSNAVIVLEKLKGIRKTSKARKSFKYDLNNRGFYQMQTFIEYKAKLAGARVEYINPAYTSKECSQCGSIETPQGKKFECSKCGFVEHRDVNASFNIASRYAQSLREGVLNESNTGVAQEAMSNTLKSVA